jgi:hypothetical protein
MRRKLLDQDRLQIPNRGRRLQAFMLSAISPTRMLYRKSTLGILLALIFLSFFGTLTLSASMLPESYDWRYQVISNLLSPRDNPGHYWLAAAGLGLSAVLMLPLVEYLRRYLKTIAPRTAKVSAGAFILGIIALICACFVVPQHADAMFGIEQLHEFLGRSAATLLVTGMLCACWCAWKGRAQLSFALSWVWSVVTVLPLTGLFVSNALLVLTRVEPSWAAPIRAALRDSVFWHLGFWEWTGAAGLFVFLCAAVFLIPAQPQGTAPSRNEA